MTMKVFCTPTIAQLRIIRYSSGGIMLLLQNTCMGSILKTRTFRPMLLQQTQVNVEQNIQQHFSSRFLKFIQIHTQGAYRVVSCSHNQKLSTIHTRSSTLSPVVLVQCMYLPAFGVKKSSYQVVVFKPPRPLPLLLIPALSSCFNFQKILAKSDCVLMPKIAR